MAKSKCKIDFINTWELYYQGAESKIYCGFHGNNPCIAKYRFPKKFRHPLLDKRLTKERTKRERRMIEKITSRSDKLGKLMPYVLWSDECTILMTRIEHSESVYNYIITNNLRHDSHEMIQLAKSIGRCIAELHNLGIIHGDLTTSNLLIKYREEQKNDQVSIKKARIDEQNLADNPYTLIPIDFGLSTGSTHSEERAVDLYVLERALSTHFADSSIFNRILETYLEDIDEDNCVPPGKHKIVERLREVRSRGRKADLKAEYSG